ncbi:MAG: hypothetical protein IPN92_13770 [Chromatiaceae bacterium]|nr:hypothetical protein [Chromatiaceae bacterium]
MALNYPGAIMNTFPDCIAHVLAAEGGLVNDPRDPGGVTKFGISQRAYPALNIRGLTPDDAKANFYRGLPPNSTSRLAGVLICLAMLPCRDSAASS